MSQKFTMWNIPCDSWEGIPAEGLKVTEELQQEILDALRQRADEEETMAYKTPVNQEQLAKIIS